MLLARLILFSIIAVIAFILFVSFIPQSANDFNYIRAWTKTNCTIFSIRQVTLQNTGKEYVEFAVKFSITQQKQIYNGTANAINGQG